MSCISPIAPADDTAPIRPALSAETQRCLSNVRCNVDGARRCRVGSVLPKGRRGTEHGERSQGGKAQAA